MDGQQKVFRTTSLRASAIWAMQSSGWNAAAEGFADAFELFLPLQLESPRCSTLTCIWAGVRRPRARTYPAACRVLHRAVCEKKKVEGTVAQISPHISHIFTPYTADGCAPPPLKGHSSKLDCCTSQLPWCHAINGHAPLAYWMQMHTWGLATFSAHQFDFSGGTLLLIFDWTGPFGWCGALKWCSEDPASQHKSLSSTIAYKGGHWHTILPNCLMAGCA